MGHIAAADVVIDGEELPDVKKVREGRRTLRKPIKLMRKRSSVKTTPDYVVELDTLIPDDGPGYDYETVTDKTLTIEYDNGIKVIYTGVDCTEIGDEEFDDDNETIRKIVLHATGRQQV